MKYPIGTKVILITKQGSISQMEKSSEYNVMIHYKKPYAYIVGIKKPENMYIIAAHYNDIESGDYYYETDIKSYVIERLKKTKTR